MCGLSGFIDSEHHLSEETLRSTVMGMANVLHHRGPDDAGAWVDPRAGIALGFRRLAILDLSPEGHQPMVSDGARYVAVFNGEIYNFIELREELEGLGHTFRGRSDTEVMLAAFLEWGITGAVTRFNGMFAVALWDCEQRVLHLMRDRLGKKPLYYGWVNRSFVFGSELKALRVHPDFRAEVDRVALALYLQHAYVPAPRSIYKGIHKLPPGCTLTVKPSAASVLSPVPYWSLSEVAKSGSEAPFTEPEEDVLSHLDELLRDAVGKRMIADVPLGAFLSGGTDSSLVVALMQAQSAKPVKTFSIGFHESGYDEAKHAKAVAGHLGTQHTELYVSAEQAMNVIPQLPVIYDEPFADSSQIPTYLVSSLARREVTVSLSGDGGDELFGGYGRYFLARRLWHDLKHIPRPLREVASTMLRVASGPRWSPSPRVVSPWIPKADSVKTTSRTSGRSSNLSQKMNLLGEVIAAESSDKLYTGLISHWKNSSDVVVGGHGQPVAAKVITKHPGLADFTDRMMYQDAVTYLPDDILVKLDRASMAVSLEARAPLLDYRVVEFAWKLPMRLKIRDQNGKWLLRQLLYKYVPREIAERPKMGFDVPIAAWLRGPLRDWTEALLDERRLADDGFFHMAPIRQRWHEHLSGTRNWQHQLWCILMFQQWLTSQNKL